MLVAAMAPAMLAAMALTTARQVDESPALMWWAASLAMEAVRLGALALASRFDPACFLAIHEGGQAVIALLLLGGALHFLGHDTRLRTLLAAVTFIAAGTATCLVNPQVPLPVLLVLNIVTAGAVGIAGILFWRHYRRHRRSISILCAGALLVFSTYLLTRLLRQLLDPGAKLVHPKQDEMHDVPICAGRNHRRSGPGAALNHCVAPATLVSSTASWVSESSWAS